MACASSRARSPDARPDRAEGDLSDRLASALGDLGWRAAPLDTTRHDPHHVSEPPSPPPRGQGQRDAPNEPLEASREADEEADRS